MAFMFRLEQEDGAPADPPTLKSAVPPREQGREDGFERGCEDQYDEERAKPAPPDFCLAVGLEWDREQRD